MPPEQLGSGPIEQQFRAQMNGLAKVIDEALNGNLKGPDRKIGFALLVYPFGEVTDGRCNYISNGASRADIVKLLREQANRFDTGTI